MGEIDPIELEAKLLEQEHRLYRVLLNFGDRKNQWPDSRDPRRGAVVRAFIWKVVVLVTLIGGGGGLLAGLPLWFYYVQTVELRKQTNAMLDQTGRIVEQIDLQRIQNTNLQYQVQLQGEQFYHSRRTELLRTIYEPVQYRTNKVSGTNLVSISTSSTRIKSEAVAEYISLERHWSTDTAIDLSNAQIPRITVTKISLEKVDFSGADLGGANLSGVNLKAALLIEANLNAAILRATDFQGADLTAADFTGADLSGADLRLVKSKPFSDGQSSMFMEDLTTILTGARISNANLSGAELMYADFSRCYLDGARLGGADLRKAEFDSANLDRANLAGADLREASFKGASLRAANLIGARMGKADIMGADLTNFGHENFDGQEPEYFTREQIESAIIGESTEFPPKFGHPYFDTPVEDKIDP